MAVVFTVPGGHREIPAWVTDHARFLDWLAAADLPDDVRVGYIQGHVWVDPVPERAFAHNRVKTAVAETLGPLVRAADLGVYFGDGMLFTSPAGDFTTAADGLFVSREAIADRRVWLEGAKAGEEDTRLVGTPDLTVEVVSDGSEVKDLEWLMSGYHNAGVAEYWVVDARRRPLRFTIYRSRPSGYTAVRRAGGWVRSPVLGRSFRFAAAGQPFGRQDHVLEVR